MAGAAGSAGGPRAGGTVKVRRHGPAPSLAIQVCGRVATTIRSQSLPGPYMAGIELTLVIEQIRVDAPARQRARVRARDEVLGGLGQHASDMDMPLLQPPDSGRAPCRPRIPPPMIRVNPALSGGAAASGWAAVGCGSAQIGGGTVTVGVSLQILPAVSPGLPPFFDRAGRLADRRDRR